MTLAIKNKENPMDEKLTFKDMLLNIKVIDSNDRVRKLQDCVESEFEELVSKITEYNQDGEIVIKLKLKCDKKTKHGIDVYGEVSKKCHEAFQKIHFIVMHAQKVYILMTQTKWNYSQIT